MEYAIEMLNITKEFPGIIANDNVTLKIKKNTIHALLGENGAGKSTIMSILFGLYQPTKGTIKINGHTIQLNDGTIDDALSTINSYRYDTQVTASIVDNKLVFKNRIMNSNGITIEAGTSNFVQMTGTAGYVATAPTVSNIQTTVTGTDSVNSSHYTKTEAEAMGYTCISSALDFFNAINANSSGKFMLMNDIDLSGYGIYTIDNFHIKYL